MTDTKLAEFLKFQGYKSVEEMRERCQEVLVQCEEDIKKLGHFFNEVYEDNYHNIWQYQRSVKKALEELEELVKSEK